MNDTARIALILALAASALVAPVRAVAQATAAPATSAAVATRTLPRGLEGIELGMAMDDVKNALKKASLFDYRGDADVSLLPRENQTLIETAGFSYVKRAWFQFFDGKLFTIILSLNPEKIDHYAMFSKFSGSFGEPKELDPRTSAWNDGATRLALEKPLSVKYVDVKTAEELKAKAGAAKALEDISRERFLELFAPEGK